MLLDVVIACGVVISRRIGLGVKLVEDAFDPILACDRIVVYKPELGRTFQSEPRSDLPPQEGCCTAERPRARFTRLRVAQDRVEYARHLQIRTDLHSGERHEADARIVHFTSEHRGELASYLIGDAIRPGTLRHDIVR